MRYIFSGLVLILVLSSCSQYNKILKSSDYELKYQKALGYYQNDEVIKAGTLFEMITPVYKGTNRIDTIAYYLSMCELKRGDYFLASHHFKTLAENYPNSPFAENAVYMAAYSYYKASPRPSLDQTNTHKAIEGFIIYTAKYPNGDKVEKANQYIIEMRNKLIEKSYNSAKLYVDLEDYKASIIALNNSLNDFPDTRFREDILFLILKSHYLLADNSVKAKKAERFQETVDAYYSFIEEYPDSEHAREAEKYYEIAQRHADDNAISENLND